MLSKQEERDIQRGQDVIDDFKRRRDQQTLTGGAQGGGKTVTVERRLKEYRMNTTGMTEPEIAAAHGRFAQEDLVEELRKQFPHGHPDFLPITLAEIGLHSAKNNDYAAGGKPTGNFDRVAAILALYPGLQLSDRKVVALTYLLKQLDAVLWGLSAKIVHKVEGLKERLGDISIYSKIVMCMVADDSRAGKPQIERITLAQANESTSIDCYGVEQHTHQQCANCRAAGNCIYDHEGTRRAAERIGTAMTQQVESAKRHLAAERSAAIHRRMANFEYPRHICCNQPELCVEPNCYVRDKWLITDPRVQSVCAAT